MKIANSPLTRFVCTRTQSVASTKPSRIATTNVEYLWATIFRDRSLSVRCVCVCECVLIAVIAAASVVDVVDSDADGAIRVMCTLNYLVNTNGQHASIRKNDAAKHANNLLSVCVCVSVSCEHVIVWLSKRFSPVPARASVRSRRLVSMVAAVVGFVDVVGCRCGRRRRCCTRSVSVAIPHKSALNDDGGVLVAAQCCAVFPSTAGLMRKISVNHSTAAPKHLAMNRRSKTHDTRNRARLRRAISRPTRATSCSDRTDRTLHNLRASMRTMHEDDDDDDAVR